MKNLQLSMIVICVIGFSSLIFFIYYQNLSFQQELNLNKENLTHLNSTLSNYKNLFGEIPDNYTSIPFLLHVKVYVADPLNTTPVDLVKVNQPYQVIAQVTRQENQPLRNYYCIVQVQDEKGFDIDDGWSQQTMIPKQSFSQCAIKWIPNNLGNYTISAFAWQDLFGNARAEPAIKNVQVVPSKPYQQTIPILSDSVNVNNTDFTIRYNIVGGNVEKVNADISAHVLIIYLKTTGDGILTVDLPRGLIDMQENGHDVKFNVQADRQVINFEEIKTTNTDRILTIPFHANTQQVELIANPIP